jgi:hypothetical protein
MPWPALVVLVIQVDGVGEETGWRGFLVDSGAAPEWESSGERQDAS